MHHDDGLPAGSVPVLPERARLLHIGLMKTGTTALQRAASERRKQLLRHGVRYPGRTYNHRQAALALMRAAPVDHRPDGAAHPWTELMHEVDQDERRKIWISNEFICGSDDGTARRFLDALGSRAHVVITARSVGSVLPSLWQQYVKSGSTLDLESFLRLVLDPATVPADLPRYYLRNDQGAVVSRWARLAGPERVTVVVVDKAQPRRTHSVFEQMLALPPGFLASASDGRPAENRSLTAEEVSLVLQLNRTLPRDTVTPDEVVRILESGAIGRLLANRPDSAGRKNHLGLPPWARTRAAELGSQYAEVIAESGATVIGDLANLSRIVEAGGVWDLPDRVPVEVAAEAVLGAMSAGLHRGSNFGKPMPPPVRPPRRTTPLRLLRGAARRARTVAHQIPEGWRR